MLTNTSIIDGWKVTEQEINKSTNYRNETIFSLGNGYIGTRGTHEEAYDFSIDEGLEGNFINGFYESEDIRYGEFNFGFPKKSQSMLNITNAKIMKLTIDEEQLSIFDGKISNYQRILDLQNGFMTRTFIWETKSGKKVEISIKRLVSFKLKNLMSISYSIKPLNFTGNVMITSQIETDVFNHTSYSNPLIDYGPYGKSLILDNYHINNNQMTIMSKVKNNGFSLFTGAIHKFSQNQRQIEVNPKFSGMSYQRVTADYLVPVVQDETTEITKHIIYTHSDVDPIGCEVKGNQLLDSVSSTTFDELELFQEAYLADYWDHVDVQIGNDIQIQQGLRFNTFHILQSTGRDALTSVGAKGLSGEGYEGHYFWDTEMYVIPFYNHTQPELAKQLLMYRYNKLPEAKKHANELGHKIGALYPWRTINGNEASAYYPLGSAQYHINGDIAYAINQYGEISGDKEFMFEYGLEVLCEISRVFADVGHFSDWKDGKYVISCVTGPDEYNAIVDNNFYTNLIARETLKNTIKWLNQLKEKSGQDHETLVSKLNLQDEELVYWTRIIDNMYLGYDEKLDIFMQDDTFLQKKPWDTETDADKKKSLLYVNYHPLYVFRHQMCKQGDTPQGMLMFNHLFTEEQLRNNYDYYYPRTLHHSSLSQSIFGIIECRLGNYDQAYENFMISARMDLDDHHNNVYAGIHIANMAGTWMTLTYGLAGMNNTDGLLNFAPFLPKDWTDYSFKITYHGSQINILVKQDSIEFKLLSGEEVTFSCYGDQYSVRPDSPVQNIPLKK